MAPTLLFITGVLAGLIAGFILSRVFGRSRSGDGSGEIRLLEERLLKADQGFGAIQPATGRAKLRAPRGTAAGPTGQRTGCCKPHATGWREPGAGCAQGRPCHGTGGDGSAAE